jgi:hypothetical protein
VATSDKKSPKGFAGLDDLVSDVEVKPPSPKVPLRPSAQATQSAPYAQPPSSQPIPHRSEPVEPRQLPPKPSGLSTGWIWAICIGGLIVLANVFGGKGNSNTYTPPSQVYAPPAQTYTPPPTPVYQAPEPTYTPPAPAYEPPQQVQSYEAQPMPGTDNVLEESEIRYCLSQKIRIQGWEPNVNTYSQSSVDAFNWAISDFNSRCGSYRYRTQVMDRVRSEVNSRSTDLRFEGVNLATQNP